MSSFYKLMNRMALESRTSEIGDEGPPLLTSGEDSKAIDVIRIGDNLDANFWQNFIKILNNTEGLAELLNVKTEQVAEWAGRIKDHLDKAKESENSDEKNTLVSTGDQEPLADPSGDVGPITTPNDTRPT
jgi:hypothetical protein